MGRMEVKPFEDFTPPISKREGTGECHKQVFGADVYDVE